MKNCWKARLPQLELDIACAPEAMPEVLAVAGGRQPACAWLRKLAGQRRIVCADRGAVYCLEAGLRPAALYGDGDSAAAEIYQAAENAGTVLHRFAREKDDTDLQLLLRELPAARLLISGVWGGRFDHLYSNVFSLLAYKERTAAQVLMADEHEAMLLLTSGESARGRLQPGRRVQALSILPLAAQTTVTLDGARWPLQAEVVELFRPYAISNLPQQEFTCVCHGGALGLYFCFDEPA